MKSFINFSFLIFLGALASASQKARLADGRGSMESCARRSSYAVKALDTEKKYDRGGIMTYGCEIADNKAAVLCEVSATKGDGSATDTFLVVLSKDCRKVYRVELTGEE